MSRLCRPRWIVAVLAPLGLAAWLAPIGQGAPLPGYRLEAEWPAASHGLPAPGNLAPGPDGRLWVLDGAAGAVVALNPDGSPSERRTVPSDSLDLALEPGGDLYLGRWSAAPLRSTVGRYDAAGNAAWTRQSDSATGTGVAATAGRVWYTEPSQGALTWFGRSDGRVSGQIAPRGVQPGFPADLAVAPDGTLFATDLIGGAIFAWPEPYLPNDLATWTMLESSGPFRIGVGAQEDGALVVAALFSDGLVRVHRPDGSLLARFFVPGEPLDLAVDQRARIYVLDELSRAIRVYAPGAPPTPTPLPPDPPKVPASCQVQGSRRLADEALPRCGRTTVELHLQALCPPGAVTGADVAVIIDVSQSMRNGKLEGAREAARRFLRGLDFRHHRAALVSFSNEARVEQGLTGDPAALEAALDRLTPVGSATNIYAALRSAADHLAAEGRPNALPTVILLTDGEPSRPIAPEPGTAALVAAERLRARRGYVVTIGLGNFVDSLLLETIASAPEDFYYAPSVVDLDRIYSSILQVVAGVSLTDLVLEDRPEAPFAGYLPGSGRPPPLLVNDTLTWTFPTLPQAGLTLSYTIKAELPGRGPVGRASLRYTDADGTRRSYLFPEPALTVWLPTPTPGAGPEPSPPAGSPLPPTLPPPTPVPTPAPADCPAGEAWWLSLVVYPDSVGAGPYACPGCNGLYDSGDYWRPVAGSLAPARLAVLDAADRPLWIGEVRPAGGRAPARAHLRLCAPPPYRVRLLSAPPGYQSCPNSPTERLVSPLPGPARRAEARFMLWQACGLAPSPVPPPSPQPSPPPELPPCP